MDDHDSPVSAENQPTDQPVDALDVPAIDDVPLMHWQASEYIHHQKNPGWYVALVVATVGLVALGVWTHQWSSIAVLIAGIVAILVYANKPPRTLNYTLSTGGLTIDQKFYPYTHFRSFSVVSEVAWHAIDLDPVQRFMPRLTILFEDKDLDEIVKTLATELPRADRQPDVIERLTRLLKF